MNLIFGLTGSIACGKSTVSRFLEKAGCIIVDADLIARDVVVPGSLGLSLIRQEFGEEMIAADGTLDRPKLANQVFNCQEDLKRINAIMHPLIEQRANYLIGEACKYSDKPVIYDSALIIETNKADKFRPLIVVSCPYETQLTRLMKRNNLSESDAIARINKQLSSDEKAKHADFVITTTGTLDELEAKTNSVLLAIKNGIGRTDQKDKAEAFTEATDS